MQATDKPDSKVNTEQVANNDTLIIDPDSDSNSTEDSISKGCSGISISDFQLKALSLNSSLQIVDQDLTISLEKNTLQVKALKDVTVKQLFLVLSSTGNKILSLDNKEFNLKTPSGQTSGLKLHLIKSVNLEKDKNYLLKLTIDPAEQIVANPSKCLFKPVIKGVVIE